MFLNTRLQRRESLPSKFGAITLGQITAPAERLPETPQALTYIPPGGAYVTVPGIEGTWVFTQVGGDFSGEFEIWRENEQYKGRIRFGMTGVWHDLVDVSFDERTKQLSFYSPYWDDTSGIAVEVPQDVKYHPYLQFIWSGHQKFLPYLELKRIDPSLMNRVIKWSGVLAGNQLSGKFTIYGYGPPPVITSGGPF